MCYPDTAFKYLQPSQRFSPNLSNISCTASKKSIQSLFQVDFFFSFVSCRKLICRSHRQSSSASVLHLVVKSMTHLCTDCKDKINISDSDRSLKVHKLVNIRWYDENKTSSLNFFSLVPLKHTVYFPLLDFCK